MMIIKKIYNYLLKAPYYKYFIIFWIISYIVVNFIIDMRANSIGIWAYQPFTVVIFSFTYVYSSIVYYAIKTPKEKMTLIKSVLTAMFIFITLGLFLEVMDNICKFAYNHGFDIWFLWGTK